MDNPKPKKFVLHFNRINMQRGNPAVWTVHNSEGCHQAEEVVVKVPLETRYRPNGRQPRAVLTGRGVVRRISPAVVEVTPQ